LYKDQKTNQEPKLLLCFFHFSQALWKRASALGMKEKSTLKDAKNIIINLQLISFIDLPFKLEHYDRVKAEFQERNEIFKEFFNYFELTWVKGQYFSLTDWNYYRALNETELSVELSKNFHITNNAVGSCNAILNSCLHRGK
jgi:hypothetical protein